MFKKFLYINLICLFFASSTYSATWQRLSAGIEYLNLKYRFGGPRASIHIFRVDPNYNFFSIITAKDLFAKSISVKSLSKLENPLIAVNGGFFAQNHHPLGLRISNSKLKNPLKKISWWDVFYIENKKAHLVSMDRFQMNNKINFAIQAGPRLLINKKIPGLKPGMAARSALGITNNNKIIILVTERATMSTHTLAKIMLNYLDCNNALNLDGGSSSQLLAMVGKFRLSVKGFSNLSDAIIIN